MPTYDYRCEKCGHEMAVFQSITADRLTKCPKCSEEALRRLIGAGAGIIFKGSGFYETDYKRARKSSSDSKQGEGDSKKSDSDSKPSKSDSGGDSKTSSKSKSDD